VITQPDGDWKQNTGSKKDSITLQTYLVKILKRNRVVRRGVVKQTELN
jgi:hypothetical protein